MPRLHVNGIVREANRFRQALTLPMTFARRDALARQRHRFVAQVDDLLRRHGGSPAHLPGPSHRAYLFLKRLDLDGIKLVDDLGPPCISAPPDSSVRIADESIRFTGLRVFFDQILDDAASAIAAQRFSAAAFHCIVGGTAERLNHVIDRDHLQPKQIKPESRDLLAWFRYFAREEAIGTYADAVGRAQKTFAGSDFAPLRWKLPLLVHFRPSQHLYRWKILSDATRITLSTPMITFDEHILEELMQQMLGRRHSPPTVTAAMLSDAYQTVVLELESSGGIVERTRGIAHDLGESFARVNAQYFGGQSSRPKLTWNRRITGFKFGHYDYVQDTVMVSCTLDRADVPAFVVDHVMHHELLHKKHGFRWRSGRQCVHTAAFRAEEASFAQYAAADQFLRKLSAERV